MFDRISAGGKRVSRFIGDHPGKAFLITAAAIIVTAVDVQRAFSDESTHVGALTWLAVGLMAFSVAETFVAPRFVASTMRTSFAWSMALTPFLWGVVAAETGSPPRLIWVGVLLSLFLTAWVAVKVGGRGRA